jgi:hypothetical protein
MVFFLLSSCTAKKEKKHTESAGKISTPAPTRKKNEVIGGIKMEQKVIKSLLGSPVPEDIFEPHMPGVDVEVLSKLE